MTREECEKLELTDILKNINDKHGLTKGNSLVAREMTRIYNKICPADLIMKVKKEAALKTSSLKMNYETPIQPKRRIFLTESAKRRWEEQQAKLVQNI